MATKIPRYAQFLQWLRAEEEKKGLRKKKVKRTLTPEEERVRSWITDNRGMVTEIAVRASVSAQFVHMVAYGRSTARPGHEVERMLDAAGCPVIRR
jgi:hypothetical protein